jgi:hypothetical protein
MGAPIILWERFMTKPVVEEYLEGDCPTPWPCFVIAVRDEILEKYPEAIKTS